MPKATATKVSKRSSAKPRYERIENGFKVNFNQPEPKRKASGQAIFDCVTDCVFAFLKHGLDEDETRLAAGSLLARLVSVEYDLSPANRRRLEADIDEVVANAIA